ncbi:uncharacterized protein EDB91DRAFT_1048103 [Suillus paluster]|uniref:uncharacterized protein n=1 Tax=Suillus paluster TaxID=48578 RepID=UPI001B87340D|nr:uncharacterized protein EDB91DRAFT_1048103 [Suillus paluster]KAG1747893.1 hypothetical protein EDB91DRAFT_1048103 [Suillus paluster]
MNNVGIHEDEYTSQELSTCPDVGGHDSDSTMAYKMVERQHPDISFCDLDSIISSPKQSAARRSHETTGSYLSVGTDEQEEILEDEEGTWLDETLAAKPAEDSAFDIEADANLHALIVTKALSDEHEESPINGLCSTQGDATEDDADLEGMDNEWDEFW